MFNNKKIEEKVVLSISHVLDKNEVKEISRNKEILNSLIKTTIFYVLIKMAN